MSDAVRDNTALHRFELDVDGATAFSDYRRSSDVLTIMHTEVPPALNGKGVGSRLAHGLLDLARAERARVKPLCPFLRSYIAKHPEYADLVA
jgi:predicted GNAT family acetyltransferase